MSRLLAGDAAHADLSIVDRTPLRGWIAVALVAAGLGGIAVQPGRARTVTRPVVVVDVAARGHIGVVISNMTPPAIARAGIGAPTAGALVLEVEPGSPAAAAGVRTGDVIVRIDSTPTATSGQVQRRVLASTVGQPLPLEVWRAGTTLQLVASPSAETPAQLSRRTACGCTLPR
jgi:serine protease Do